MVDRSLFLTNDGIPCLRKKGTVMLIWRCFRVLKLVSGLKATPGEGITETDK